MTVLAWLLIGLAVGVLVSQFSRDRKSLLPDILVGLGGSVAGGLALLAGNGGETGARIWIVAVALAGAAVALAIYHAFVRRRK